MQPTALPPLFLQRQRLQVQQRQCQQFVLLPSSAAWRNTRVSVSSWVHPLIWFWSSVDDETTLSQQVETSILRETGVLSFFKLFFWKERKTGHSCSHRSSRSSSGWKVMVPKVTPYDVDLGPVCFLSRPSSCLRDKRPKQYPAVEHSEGVQKCKARRRCCRSPGKCLMSWGRAFEQQMHRQGSLHLLQVSGLQQGMQQCLFADQLFLFLRTRFKLSCTDKSESSSLAISSVTGSIVSS